MSDINLIKDMTAAIQAAGQQTKRTEAYDTPATVTRVEDNTAWVHIPGGIDETPVRLTISVKPGDTVQIRVGQGSAWLVGNQTAPPTDDTTANKAIQKAAEASGVATNFVTDMRDGIFVHPKDNDKDGVRITDAIEILKGGISYIRAYIEGEIAKVRVGREDSGHSVIDSNGMRIFGGNGSQELANIGYGDGNALIGTETAPYFTFGDRSGSPGIYSVAEGSDAEASGAFSHAEGSSCVASKQSAHAEGLQTTASHTAAHAEGWSCTASGECSHAEGDSTTASGPYGSHAEGYNNTASGAYSHAGGCGNTAAYAGQTVIGKYAASPASDDLFIVGNGSSASSRSNAMRLKDNGRVEFAGAVGSGLSWDDRTGMVNAMTGLSLNKPYLFYAGSTWSGTAGASGSAFGIICKTSTTDWRLFFMAGGNVYKSAFDSSALTFSTTQIG